MRGVTLICVGRLRERFYIDAADEYIKRLGAYCKLKVIEIPESRHGGMTKEAEFIRAAVPDNSMTFALCVEGEEYTSEEFAERLEIAEIHGVSQFAFIIGGSDGLDEKIKREAKVRMSMSKMTFPHHLARVMFLEQLYRAYNILSGGKYNK